jgi:hypothetical protein
VFVELTGIFEQSGQRVPKLARLRLCESNPDVVQLLVFAVSSIRVG